MAFRALFTERKIKNLDSRKMVTFLRSYRANLKQDDPHFRSMSNLIEALYENPSMPIYTLIQKCFPLMTEVSFLKYLEIVRLLYYFRRFKTKLRP